MIISEKQEQKDREEGRNENASEYSDIYSNIKKEDVVNEAKCFHKQDIQPDKCNEILAKIIYLANHVDLIVIE